MDDCTKKKIGNMPDRQCQEGIVEVITFVPQELIAERFVETIKENIVNMVLWEEHFKDPLWAVLFKPFISSETLEACALIGLHLLAAEDEAGSRVVSLLMLETCGDTVAPKSTR